MKRNSKYGAGHHLEFRQSTLNVEPLKKCVSLSTESSHFVAFDLTKIRKAAVAILNIEKML